ncbi:MAG: hypothetical protein M0C28_23080 [Candidatus Moduliflexus flocculans]|nr:hypothetical protein [Candidatus Moduliflexus flocculans]
MTTSVMMAWRSWSVMLRPAARVRAHLRSYGDARAAGVLAARCASRPGYDASTGRPAGTMTAAMDPGSPASRRAAWDSRSA